MDARQKELAEIKSYIEGIDKEVTMILQSLQWDRKHLIEVRLIHISFILKVIIVPLSFFSFV